MGFWSNRKMLKPGERAPEFSLRSLDASAQDLKDILAAGPVLLAFYKGSCPVCQLTFPFLERLYREGEQGRLQFRAISQDGDSETREFLKEFGITFPVLLDESRRGYPASNAFGISTVPSMFLVEPDGRISWASNGFSRPDLEELGPRVSTATFRPDEDVPSWKAG